MSFQTKPLKKAQSRIVIADYKLSQPRPPISKSKAFMAAGSIGLFIGACIGAAYMGVTFSRNEGLASRTVRLNEIAAYNYGKDHFLNMSALRINTSSVEVNSNAPTKAWVDQSAMAIAMRYDPTLAPNSAMRDRQDIALAQKLISLRGNSRFERPTGLPIVQASLGMDLNQNAKLKPNAANAAGAFALQNRNQNDLDCLTQAVYYEARGEGEAGMRAVAQVILNRVRHPAFPKTICGVVYQGGYRAGCQFSFACDGTMARRVENWAWKRSKITAEAALSGYVMSAIGTSTHFHTQDVRPAWASRLNYITTIGSHIFYQFQGKGARISQAADVSASSLPQTRETLPNTASQNINEPDTIVREQVPPPHEAAQAISHSKLNPETTPTVVKTELVVASQD